MTKIAFATTNSGKVESLNLFFDPNQFLIEQVIIDLPEIQADTAVEICEFKAKTAYSMLKKPLIVQDSAFHILALGGFPGPYIKYIQGTIGTEGVLKLMQNQTDRSCYFQSALTYIDGDGHLKTFQRSRYSGTLALQEYQGQASKAWGSIGKIFIPSWSDGRTLAEVTTEELDHHQMEEENDSEFAQFAAWLKNIN